MTIQALHRKNYLKMIENSVGTNMFRNLYVVDTEEGREFDATDDGDKSCARFVTSVLALFGMIDRPHATVKTTIKKLEESPDWTTVKEPQSGDVVVWKRHIGFVVDEKHCISNSSKDRHPTKHAMTMDDGRKPLAFWRFNSSTSP